jgi:hypothetical protein
MRRTVLLLVMGTAMLLALGGAALAVTSVSGVPDAASVQVDGRVSAVLVSGGRVYLGGSFTHVNGAERNHLAAIDAATGELTGWDPNANGSVRSLAASSDGTRIYAGGTFTGIGGVYRGRLAAIDAATGALDAAFKPGTANSTVRAIAVSGNRVYLGGDFTTVKGASRGRLALVDGATGALDPDWTPSADAAVLALGASPDGARVYAGGAFTAIDGQSVRHLAALGAGTGAPDGAWKKPTKPNGKVYDLEQSGGLLYTGEGGLGGAASAYDAATGERAWRAEGDGDVQAVTVMGGEVYLGGHFVALGGQDRRFFAAVDASTGVLDPWDPRGGGTGLGVWSLGADPLRTRVYAGGDFSRVSGAPHGRFAQFSG